MTLTVIGPVQSRTSRVLWCLEELGLAYEHLPERPHSEPVNALNPLRQVPILRDGEEVLTDSVAIMHYLCDREGRLTYPSGSVARARMEARINFLLTELEAPLWMMSRHSFVLPEDMRRPEIFPVLETDFRMAEKKFLRLLGDAEFFGGPDFSIADIVAAHVLNWAGNMPWGIGLDAARAFRDRMIARPAWARSRQGA